MLGRLCFPFWEGYIFRSNTEQLYSPKRTTEGHHGIKKIDTRVQGNIFVTQNPFVRIEGLWCSLQTEVDNKAPSFPFGKMWLLSPTLWGRSPRFFGGTHPLQLLGGLRLETPKLQVMMVCLLPTMEVETMILSLAHLFEGNPQRIQNSTQQK